MKKNSIAKKLCVIGVAVACLGCVGGVVGCSSADVNESVAATVDGNEITEGDIADEVQAYRESHDLTDDEAWEDYLENHGYTPETFREAMIDDLVENDLVEKECEERGITVEPEEIDSFVDSMRDYYGTQNGIETDEDWEAFLADQGLTEEEYRSNYKSNTLSSKLKAALAEETESGDQDTTAQDEAYDKWLSEAKEKANVLIVDMPEGLSYDVKISDSESSSSSDSENSNNSSAN